MAFSPGPKDREIAVDVFGGLVTEVAPPALPIGCSPDCSDMEFLPGGVSSRRGFKKIFASPTVPSGNITYAKTFIDSAGTGRNLYLYDDGSLTIESVASPGTETLLTTVSPNSLAKSVTAFGREYISISDSLHGSEIPIQYDGVNLDRVTQDGPGVSPVVNTFFLPSVAMVATGPPSTLTITEIDPAGGDGTYFSSANIFVTAGAGAVNPGDIVTVTGTTGTFNGTYTVTASYDPTLVQVAAYFPAGTGFYVGAGTLTITSGVTMTRAGNIVTVSTATAHQLQVGYQAQITGVPAATIGTSISSIVINNENLPGLATVTTATAHGLQPGLFVSITGVNAVVVGSSISSIVRAGQVVTVTTATAHGLSPGASVTISGVTNTSFNTTAQVATVNSATVFTYVQVDVDASDSTGSVSINWPIPFTPTPTYFEVVSAPTTTSFQIAVNYSDGTWSSGSVSYAWNGTFFVATVPSTTTFTYQQYGPNATATTVGTVTPFGQCAPGRHQLQMSFLTRNGYITKPSPPVAFTASGGQYISVTNIPVGPSNVVARICQFTGANGAFFFYIPVPAQVNGQVVSTSTVINDNTSASAVFDFSDNTLFAALGTSIQGNNLAALIKLEGALSFGFYGSRLFTYGQRNIIQNLLNTGFDGGYLPTATTLPTGWDVVVAGGALAAGHFGSGWLITPVAGAGPKGELSQGFFEDAYSAPIATPSVQYLIRGWFKPSAASSNLTFTAKISSASSGFSATATLSGAVMNTAGSWLTASFSAPMPTVIPDDMLFSIYASSVTTAPTLLIDELSIIYTAKPYLTGTLWSYVNNPDSFDGLSGVLTPVNDTHRVMNTAIIKNALHLLTLDPGGRLHETSDNGVTEPFGWTISEVASNCGVLSTFGLTVSQGDDATASGGDEWFMWAGSDGVVIFNGGSPDKISQEIQPDWGTINSAAQSKIWAVNDYVNNTAYFGLPLGETTVPNKIYVLNYRELNSAGAIAGSPPFRVGYGGKLTASDNSRKWCPWNRATNNGALLYRSAGSVSMTFLGANSHGNAYTLDAAKLTDDDYGLIVPYYTTAALPGSELEIALQLGTARKMLSYVSAYISGNANSNITIAPLCDSLSNAWSITCVRPAIANPKNDMEWGGGCCQAQRIFLKISSAPIGSTNNSFSLSRLAVAIRTDAPLRVRGAPQS